MYDKRAAQTLSGVILVSADVFALLTAFLRKTSEIRTGFSPFSDGKSYPRLVILGALLAATLLIFLLVRFLRETKQKKTILFRYLFWGLSLVSFAAAELSYAPFAPAQVILLAALFLSILTACLSSDGTSGPVIVSIGLGIAMLFSILLIPVMSKIERPVIERDVREGWFAVVEQETAGEPVQADDPTEDTPVIGITMEGEEPDIGVMIDMHQEGFDRDVPEKQEPDEEPEPDEPDIPPEEAPEMPAPAKRASGIPLWIPLAAALCAVIFALAQTVKRFPPTLLQKINHAYETLARDFYISDDVKQRMTRIRFSREGESEEDYEALEAEVKKARGVMRYRRRYGKLLLGWITDRFFRLSMGLRNRKAQAK